MQNLLIACYGKSMSNLISVINPLDGKVVRVNMHVKCVERNTIISS